MTGNGSGGDSGTEQAGKEQELLVNELHLEQEKNKVLLEEVVTMEDALVNRQMAEFEGVISNETREFWREQLLANREKAETALRELAQSRSVDPSTESRTGSGGRRPLHNRETARPAARSADGSPSTGSAFGRAVKIRNRAHELSKTEGIPFSMAFRRAEMEIRGE